MSIENRQPYRDLVRKTYRQVDLEFGVLIQIVGGVDQDLGFIPLEVPFEILERRASELGLRISAFLGPCNPFTRFNFITSGRSIYPVILVEMEGQWWVPDYNFDDFKQMFGISRGAEDVLDDDNGAVG